MDDDDTPPPLSSLEDQINAVSHGVHLVPRAAGQDDEDALLPLATTTIVGSKPGEAHSAGAMPMPSHPHTCPLPSMSPSS